MFIFVMDEMFLRQTSSQQWIVHIFFPDSKGFGSSANENDLLTELKILSCLGSHPNVLNLFGACTLKGE